MNELGQAWEDLACRHLHSAGLELLARNFRTRFGELDLVMREAGVLVFVEVRYRARSDYGGAAASITGSKRGRLAVAAEQFRQQHPALAGLPCRFDVVAISGRQPNPRIDWHRAAFDLGGN